MTNPYTVLELSPGSTEEQIRKAYLEQVRKYPPDRDPERFAKIRDAYDQLRDPVTRMRSRVFTISSLDSIDDLLRDMQQKGTGATAKLSIVSVLKLAESL